ncbi:MAG: hypothetical protein AB8G15_00190 [Saprospiraceae bacterium]
MKNGIYLYLWTMLILLSIATPLEALPNRDFAPKEVVAPTAPQKKLSKKKKRNYRKRLKRMRAKLRKGKKLSKGEKAGMYMIFAGLGLLTTGAILYFANVTGTGTLLLLIGFILGFVGGIVWFLGSLFRRKNARRDKKSRRSKRKSSKD